MKLSQYFEMADIGNYGVDWERFIGGDTKRLLPNLVSINVNKFLSNSDFKIVLLSNFTSVIVSKSTGDRLFTLKKQYRSSKGSVSYLGNGVMYLSVEDSGALEFGEGYKHPEIMDYSGETPVPVGSYMYIKGS